MGGRQQSTLVTGMRSAVAVIERLSMTETTFGRWARTDAGKVHISRWRDVVRVLIRRERNSFERALHFLLGLVIEGPLARIRGTACVGGIIRRRVRSLKRGDVCKRGCGSLRRLCDRKEARRTVACHHVGSRAVERRQHA
jgi:hypothetical protein